MNRLYFGDNLKWLSDRKEFPDASVDLVYLDPPFNSNADYNVLFREPSGQVSQAQFHAFTDTWSWADAAGTYHAFIDNCPNIAVLELMEALHSFLKHSPMMAYLAMMAPRLVELHRVLKPTGSLYLHCDPTASHYLRIILMKSAEPSVSKMKLLGKERRRITILSALEELVTGSYFFPEALEKPLTVSPAPTHKSNSSVTNMKMKTVYFVPRTLPLPIFPKPELLNGEEHTPGQIGNGDSQSRNSSDCTSKAASFFSAMGSRAKMG